MIFQTLPLAQAEGALLAHSHKSASIRLRKGQKLTQSHLAQLRSDGILNVTVAKLGTDDVHEDEAAEAIASALQCENTRLGSASTGRVNIHAQCAGVVEISISAINAINRVDESITVATVVSSTRVVAGQIIATVKIIPYATTRVHLDTALTLTRSALILHPGLPARVCLIQSTLPALKPSVLDKTRSVTEQRLLVREATLLDEQRVPHRIENINQALDKALSLNPDWILIFGASATSDRNDVVPAALTESGGQILHFGMPMDPGNLLLIGQIGNSTVIGMPGCARSIKHNGVDKVLDRLWCRMSVSSHWITGLGVGGLLQELVDRPRPRVVAQEIKKVSALVLAAGSSRRFGENNKLLQSWQGKPLLHHVLQTITDSQIEHITLITGHQDASIAQSVKNLEQILPVHCLHNDAHATGMASSLVRGVSALVNYDAIVVVLADMPAVNPAAINALIDAFKSYPDKALYIPVHEGKRGNPVLISSQLFDSILALRGDTGARKLARQFPDAVMEVETDCAGVLQDIDTQDDLHQLASKS